MDMVNGLRTKAKTHNELWGLIIIVN